MPFFEISGELFETEYGPITEKEVFEALDDMTAYYILSEGNFSDLRLKAAEEKVMATAHETLERITNTALGIGLGLTSLVPGPMGAPVRKSIGLFAGGLRLATGSQTVDALMRRRVKAEIRYMVLRKEIALRKAQQEGR